MTMRGSTPPKRRAADHPTITDSSASVAKASRFPLPPNPSSVSLAASSIPSSSTSTSSAFVPNPSAPSFTPTPSSAAAKSKLSGKDGDGIIGTNIDAPVRAAMANAIALSRVTRPLPGSRRAAVGADFVPKAPEVVKGLEAKEGTRRLIVVLSQVSRVKFVLAVGRSEGVGVG